MRGTDAGIQALAAALLIAGCTGEVLMGQTGASTSSSTSSSSTSSSASSSTSSSSTSSSASSSSSSGTSSSSTTSSSASSTSSSSSTSSCSSGGGCVPKTCAEQGFNCGVVGDGCAGLLDCGVCTSTCALVTCGGGGQPNVCGAPPGTPMTCAQAGYTCGPAPDGCCGTIDCGTCPAGQQCGGFCGDAPGVCMPAGGGACCTQTCAEQGRECGMAGDGCGNVLDCGPCPAGLTCGYPGPGQCGTPCAP